MVLTHPDTFSSSIYDQTRPGDGPHPAELEGAEHRASRALVSPSFRSALVGAVAQWGAKLVEVVVHELIDGFTPRGRLELAREFTLRLSGAGHRPDHGPAAPGLPAVPTALHRVAQCGLRLGARDRRLCRAEDLFHRDSRRAAASSAGRPDQHAGGVGARRRAADRRRDLRVPAAHPAWPGRERHRASGNLLVAMLTQPALLATLRADPGMLPGAFEEALRWELLITTVVRLAVRDCELSDVADSGGDVNVSVSVAAANRDPTRYPDPDRFDATRQHIAHLTFGGGPHLVPVHAPGAHGGDSGDQRAAGSAAGFAAGPKRAAAPCRGDGFSLAGGAAGRVQLQLTPFAGERMPCQVGDGLAVGASSTATSE